MSSSIRGVHVSPGIYTAEEELTYATKSLGITTLGLVGETQRGPAFEPVRIENWREFQTVFGGTSTEKFKDTQYPKYELPYIAKSYLSESNQLEVCRVLGLSGYNAGPAWVIKLGAINPNSKYHNSALAVLRSRGFYQPYFKETATGTTSNGEQTVSDCTCGNNVKYDYQRFRVGELKHAECSGVSGKTDGSDTSKKFTSRQFDLTTVRLKPYTPTETFGDECEGYSLRPGDVYNGQAYVCESTADNLGKFNIEIILSKDFHEAGNWTLDDVAAKSCESSDVGKPKPDYIYSVSLNPADKNYILKVLGTNPDNGTAPLYVESLYDIALEQGIVRDEIRGVLQNMAMFEPALISDYCKVDAVYDLLNKPEGSLTRADVGKRFLAGQDAVEAQIHYNLLVKNSNALQTDDVKYSETEKNEDGTPKATEEKYEKDSNGYVIDVVEPGRIYIVKQFTLSTGKRKYLYVKTNESLVTVSASTDTFEVSTENRETGVVKVNADGLYYKLVSKDYTNADGTSGSTCDVKPVTVDLNNYKAPYSFASTPWFVSNVKGDYNHIEVNRLFRFHTISDGTSSNYEIKVSIEDIRPDEGTFDVVVRNINDVDESIQSLEKFSRCNLVPGDSKFIGYKIGTSDGEYESKSKYITVELYGDGVVYQNSVPAGFLGYPHGFNNGSSLLEVKEFKSDESGNTIYSATTASTITPPVMLYNCNYDEDVKSRKQYFGLSSITGVDVDAFTFKGTCAYVEVPEYLTNGFHLDCRMDSDSYTSTNSSGTGRADLSITVDGETGFVFDTVSVDTRTSILDKAPIIDTEMEMEGSIFEDSKLRKFTVYFYGGFDGWDIYRKSRTNTNDYKMTKYRGEYSDVSGEGYAFDKIKDPEALGLNQNGITSDWYAYLAGYRKFSNPEEIDVNIFATPGIDLINNTSLAEEVIDMVEQERADSIYVATTPDKPSGASDYVDEMYSPEDIVDELEDTEIDSNYTCTYYPWVKYFDVDNSQYIYLPATKDVVRNMALTDNQSYSWFPPAGLDRGDVQGVRTHYVTRLADEDILYAGRINPVKSFSQEGLKIWGQKNLQIEEGQLNRIAVRRLLLRMRKLISIACLSLIFTPNDAQTKQSLQGLITPIMDNIRSNRGISDYRVEISSSDATNEDRRELNARILFKPISSLEYINLMFSVTPEGVSFDDI